MVHSYGKTNAGLTLALLEWISGDNTLVENWENTNSDTLNYHQQQLAQIMPFQEIQDHAQDATVFYGMANVSLKSYRQDNAKATRTIAPRSHLYDWG